MPNKNKQTSQTQTRPIDPFGDELRDFETNVARALHGAAQGVTDEAMIEAPEQVIAYYNPNGLGTANYFIYRGCKVYPTGKMAETIEAETQHMQTTLHGLPGTITQ